jgi:geranylgeranyl diphosphate synthase, type II
MNIRGRIENALEIRLAQATRVSCPPRLARAMHYAVFPGGSRLRPELCITVAEACGSVRPQLAEASAAAIELLHCASLVYDDLPCFDDAPIRRGLSTVHILFGEEVAVLVGNALTVLAFETVMRETAGQPQVLLELLQAVARGVDCSSGIVAGQAWESEEVVDDIAGYHRAKTGALFESAILAGAIVGGDDPERWSGLGYCFGEAYQVIDDLRDAHSSAELLGKPVGRDAALGRPSAVATLGAAGCVRRITELVETASARVPPCPGRAQVVVLIQRLTAHLAQSRTRAPSAPGRVSPSSAPPSAAPTLEKRRPE